MEFKKLVNSTKGKISEKDSKGPGSRMNYTGYGETLKDEISETSSETSSEQSELDDDDFGTNDKYNLIK